MGLFGSSSAGRLVQTDDDEIKHIPSAAIERGVIFEEISLDEMGKRIAGERGTTQREVLTHLPKEMDIRVSTTFAGTEFQDRLPDAINLRGTIQQMRIDDKSGKVFVQLDDEDRWYEVRQPELFQRYGVESAVVTVVGVIAVVGATAWHLLNNTGANSPRENGPRSTTSSPAENGGRPSGFLDHSMNPPFEYSGEDGDAIAELMQGVIYVDRITGEHIYPIFSNEEYDPEKHIMIPSQAGQASEFTGSMKRAFKEFQTYEDERSRWRADIIMNGFDLKAHTEKEIKDALVYKADPETGVKKPDVVWDDLSDRRKKLIASYAQFGSNSDLLEDCDYVVAYSGDDSIDTYQNIDFVPVPCRREQK